MLPQISKRIILFVFTFYFVNIAKTQNVYFSWVKQFDGGTVFNEGYAITTDAFGNVYTTGCFSGVIDFDPGPGTFTLGGTSTGLAIFVLKLDANGNFIWAKEFVCTDNCAGKGILVDQLGNVYTTGYMKGKVDFDPAPSTYTLETLPNVQDSYVSKLDVNGNFVWALKMSGNLFTSNTLLHVGLSIDQDAIGNIYISGNFFGTVDFDPGPSTYTLTSLGSTDAFVSKLDAFGNFVWVKRIGGPSSEYGNSLVVEANGNVYLTGSFGQTLDFDPGPGTYTMSAVASDVYIVKLDFGGNFMWAKKIGGNGNEAANSIRLDAAGNIYLTGHFDDTADFDPGAGTYTISTMSKDIFISKLDALGGFVWAKRIGGSSADEGIAIDVDPNGNVFTAGIFINTVDFDPGPGTFNLTSLDPGSSNSFISKLNNAGDFVWAGVFTSSVNPNYLSAMKVDTLGYVHTTGQFYSDTDFDPGASVFTSTLQSGSSIFVHKMGQCASLSASIISQNNVLCNGGSNGAVTLSVIGGSGFSYTWNPNISSTYSATGLTAGIYICAITNSCGTSGIYTVLITQPPAISLTVVSSNSMLCAGDPSTIIAIASGGTGALSYSWTNGPISNSYIVTPSITAIYTINVIDSNNCLGSAVFTQSVDACAGVAEFENKVYWLLYPNPSVNNFYFESFTELSGSLILLNSLGQKIIETIVSKGKNHIVTENISKGVYYCLFINNEVQIQLGKILIE